MSKTLLKNLGRRHARALRFLPVLAATLASVAGLHAAAPTNAVVEMTFSEGTGNTTANSGLLAGTASFDPGTTTGGYPMFTNNVPVGAYAPTNNPFAIAFGPAEAAGGGKAVDLTTANGPAGSPGNFAQMTICGWVNSLDIAAGSGGNRIAFALETPNGLGFDLVQRSSGNLSLIINQYNDGSPNSSPGMITADASGSTNNWVFFAVTYDPTLAADNVKFYFGRANRLAGLDLSRTYTGAGNAPNPGYIDYTGPLTVGNFGSVEAARTAATTASRSYRGSIDQLRIYTNAFTIEQIQQAQLEREVPAVPAVILIPPTNQTVAVGQSPKFIVDANGSGLVTYQWRTNGVNVPGATNSTFTLPSVTVADSGKIITVVVDNALTADPGVVSPNATLTVVPPPTPGLFILPNDDVFVDGSGVYNAWSQSSQVNWGLAASGGNAGARRSYIEFTLGNTPVAVAKFKIYNYWGGPETGNGGRPASASILLRGTETNTPIQITEPPVGTHSDPTWVVPDQTNFVNIYNSPAGAVTNAGWYEVDITSWYNARLGQTTTLQLRGSAVSGFDFPLYEDREGTAYSGGSSNALPNTGPRIEYFLPTAAAGRFTSATTIGNQLVLQATNGTPSGTYVLLRSADPSLPTANWTRVATNQFDANGTFSITNAIDPGAAQGFYRFAVP